MLKDEILQKSSYVICAFAIIVSSCGKAEKIYSQNDIKARLMKKYKINEDWRKLEVKPFFMNNNDENNVRLFAVPKDLAIVDNKYVLVVDNNLQTVSKFDLDGSLIETFGKPGQGPGELSYPRQVYGTKNKIYVQDGRGMNVFDKSSTFLRIVNTFSSIQNFFVTEDDGRIFANSIGPNEAQDTLIEEYDENGALKKKFGKRFMRKGHNSYDSRCYLTGDGEEIIAAFYSYPLLRRYSIYGDFIGEIRIELDILAELEKLNFSNKFTHPAPNIWNLPLIMDGAKLFDNHIYVLLFLPRLEILEYEKNGKLINHYFSSEMNNIFTLAGFDVAKYKDRLAFYILFANEEDHYYNVLRASPKD